MDTNGESLGQKLNHAARLYRTTVRDRAADAGIGSTCFHILNYLRWNEGQCVTSKNICDCMGLKAPTVSVTLAEMERDGYLRRARCECDGRKVYLSLTEAGQAKADEIGGFFDDTNALLEHTLGTQELRALRGMLDKLIETMEDLRRK